MDRRILIINYKTYPSSMGSRGLEIARCADKVRRETGIEVMIAVPATMIWRVSREAEIPVLAQHVDPLEPGRGTGFLTVELVLDAGGKGSLVNHSEHRVTVSDAQKIICRLREKGLLSIACGDTPEATLSMAFLGADIVAMEPPELIGTGVSVSKAKPEIVSRTVSLVRKFFGNEKPVLVGAGVTDGEDARKAVELGADGVLVSSSVMKARDPCLKIRELAEALLKYEEGL